ncbi:MAG: ABC transporter substrate-binding protein [Dehalococcoidia bacterium]
MRQIALVLGLLALACTPALPSPSAPDLPPTDIPQHLRVISGLIPANLTPAAGSVGHSIFWTLYDSVTQFGPDFAVRPSVAQRWDLSQDGSAWTLVIRPDMTWPDGSALTADDIAFSFDQLRQRRWPQAALFSSVASATATDRTTVVLATRTPDITIPNNLAYLWVLPKAHIERVGMDQFTASPAGSGPYQIDDYRPGVSLTVKKRSAGPGGRLHAFRRPIADEIRFLAMVDPVQKINGLRSGEADIAAVQTFTASQVDLLQDGGMTVMTFPLATMALAFPDGALTLRTSPLRDRRVRLALNYAVDKAAIASLFYGSEPVGQYASPGSQYWDSAAIPFPHDLSRARHLLTEAGYPAGLRIDSGIEYQPNIIPTEIALAVQSSLAEAGIDVPIVPLEANAFLEKAYGRNGQLKAELFGTVTIDSNGFATSMRSLLGCSSPSGGGPAGRWYCNREWDRLIAEASTERDPVRRGALMREANRLQREDVPFLFLIIQPGYTVVAPNIRGLEIPSLRMFNFDSAYRVR